MIVLLYIISIITMLNHGLLILGLKRMGLAKKHIDSIILSGFSILVLISSILLKSWELLFLIFSLNLFFIIIELIVIGIKKRKKPNDLIPINLLTLFFSITAYLTENWPIFVVTYVFYWLALHFISRKRTSNRMNYSLAKESIGKSTHTYRESKKTSGYQSLDWKVFINPILNFISNIELNTLFLTKNKDYIIENHLLGKNKDEWIIEIKIFSNSISSSELGFCIWAISTVFDSLNKFDDHYKPTLIDWGNGSKWFRINLKFISPEARKEAIKLLKEAKSILLKGKDSAEAYYLNKPIKEVEKLTEETKKTTLEGEQIKQNLYSEAQSDELKELNIEEKRIQLELLRQSLIEKKLTNLEKGAELLATGLLSHKEVKFLINGQTYLSAENGKWKEETSIDEIAAKEIEDLTESQD